MSARTSAHDHFATADPHQRRDDTSTSMLPGNEFGTSWDMQQWHLGLGDRDEDGHIEFEGLGEALCNQNAEVENRYLVFFFFSLLTSA